MVSRRPAFPAARIIARHSAWFIAMGFSQSTCLPALSAAMACSLCRWLGLAIHTTSIASSARKARMSV